MAALRRSLPLLLLACLAAGAAAAGKKDVASYDCPDTPRMKGCAPSGCEMQLKGRVSTLVCGKCMDKKGYVLANAGTRKAQCECAAGYAGKGMDGVCKKCPADTDIAVGGPLAKSICAKCPKGSYVNTEGSECMCPAGHYMAVADQPLGFVRIACKPCLARNAFVAEDGHTFESCSICKLPLVANKDHTTCVSPESPDAAAEGAAGGSSSPLSSLAQAFEQGRMDGQHDRTGGSEDRTSPLRALANRFKSARAASERRHAAQQQQQYESDAEEEGYTPEQAKVEEETVEAEEEAKPAPKAQSPPKHASHGSNDDKEGGHEDRDGHHNGGHGRDHGSSAEEEEDSVAEPGVAKKQPSKKQLEQLQLQEQQAREQLQQQARAKAAKPSAPSKPSKQQQEAEQEEEIEQDEDVMPAEPGVSARKQPQQPPAAAADKPKPKEKPAATWDTNNKQGSEQLAHQLIPGLGIDPDDFKPEGAQPALLPPGAPAPAPATLLDWVKKAGGALTGKNAAGSEALGGMGVAKGGFRSGVGNVLGLIDPSALADAGLPPVNNVGALMGAIVKSQMSDLDLTDWKDGVRGRANDDN